MIPATSVPHGLITPGATIFTNFLGFKHSLGPGTYR